MKPQAKPNTSPKPKKDYRCKYCEYWKEWGWVCTLIQTRGGPCQEMQEVQT